MKKYKKYKNQGQIMIVVTLTLGGIMLGTTIIGGVLIKEQLRQVKNIADSAKSIYAADAGINWGHYRFLGKNNAQAPNFTNQATHLVQCLNDSKINVNCDSASVKFIISKGMAGKVSRAIQLSLSF